MSHRSEWGRWQAKRITPELVEELAEYVKLGCSLKIAAKRAGIPAGILRRWYRAGEEEIQAIYEAETGYPSQVGLLWEALHKAAGEVAAELIADLRLAGAGKESAPGSSGWLLERLEEDFAPAAARVEITGSEGGPIAVEGRAVVGLADVLAVARELGVGHHFGLDAGDPPSALPAPRAVLPDPPVDQPAAVPQPDVQGS